MTEISNVRRVESPGVSLGTFKAVWSGYKVRWETPTGAFEGDTKTGIRGTTDCEVIVSAMGYHVKEGKSKE